MKKIVSLLLLLPVFAMAQEQGIGFDKSPSWKDVLAKAKAENKYIFVDCFTTWCGPCKYMDANIYPKKEVGDYYNAHFVSVKLQLDSTGEDNDYVKKWREDGKYIAETYEVRAYPTYLFFDPNGTIVHRFVGGSEAAEFITRAKNSLDPEKQYYTQLNKYKTGKKDTEFLLSLAKLAQKSYDMKNAKIIADEYLATQTNLFTKDNLELLRSFTEKSSDKGFQIFFNDADKANAVLGKGAAEKVVLSIIGREEIFPVLSKHIRAKTTPNWDSVYTPLKAKYPKHAEELFIKSKLGFFAQTKNWSGFQQEIVSYMSKYGNDLNANELNSHAWTVFENCKDMSCISAALEWSKRSFKDKESPMFMDTYANLLHKLGKTTEAIEWQKKAIALLVNEEDRKGYRETLAKMEKGEKTWKE